MNIRKQLFPLRAITALTLAVALALPCVAKAAGIGEAEVKSAPGEPLLAQVTLATGRAEHIEDACFSLLGPESPQEDPGHFLTEANLTFKTEGTKQYVNISSPKPLNSSSIKLRLQVKCPGKQGVVKTLTLSPVPSTGQNEQILAASSVSEIAGATNELNSGEIGAKELALLLEQQRVLALSSLEMQHQIKLLHEEVNGIKAQLIPFGIIPSAVGVATAVAESAPLTIQAHPAVVETQENHLDSPTVAKPAETEQSIPYLKDGLLLAAGLALIVLLLGLHFHNKAKVHSPPTPQQEAIPALKTTEDVADQKMWASPGIKRPSHIAEHESTAPPLKAIIARDGAADTPQTNVKKTAAHKAEDDLLLEEAKLYANNGHPVQAVAILLDIVKRSPSKSDAWTLLLSLYSSLGKAAEFERAARYFLKYHKNSPSWSGIQALGRTLDHDNSLYAEHGDHGFPPPASPEAHELHHPIGDILIEMGVLSQREVSAYLKDFDPAKHGRFGGYLVARKAITLEQLDLALLQQQGAGSKATPTPLPSLHDIESFLADFDPKRHGSVAQFMASQNAVTPEQLGLLLQQQSKQNGALKNTPPDKPLPVDGGGAA